MDGAAALERSYTQLEKVVGNLTSEQLTAPTVCPDFDVRGLLNHTLGAATMFTLVNEGKQAGEDAGDLIGSSPAAAVAEIARTNVAAWRQPGATAGDRTYPFGTFPAAGGLMINIGEILVHAWDVAQATGQEIALDSEVSADLLAFYQSVPLDVYREHGAFGPEVRVPETAPTADRLLGLLGRKP